MKKIIEILNKIFAPRIEKHYYYGNKMPKNADKIWNKANEAFEKMNEAFEELNKV